MCPGTPPLFRRFLVCRYGLSVRQYFCSPHANRLRRSVTAYQYKDMRPEDENRMNKWEPSHCHHPIHVGGQHHLTKVWMNPTFQCAGDCATLSIAARKSRFTETCEQVCPRKHRFNGRMRSCFFFFFFYFFLVSAQSYDPICECSIVKSVSKESEYRYPLSQRLRFSAD